LSDRAIKYGLLFIALTFAAVAMVEVMRRLRVHPSSTCWWVAR
jgi:inner membrane protein